MPRMARQKTYDAIFHVMCKSITEIDLFRDNLDKLEYLRLIGEYQKIFSFRIYKIRDGYQLI